MPTIEQQPRPEAPKEKRYERPVDFEVKRSLRLDVALATAGKKEPNEDAVIFDETGNMVAVFDGVGGSQKGDLASHLSRDNLAGMLAAGRTYLEQTTPADRSALWRQLLEGNSYVTKAELDETRKEIDEAGDDPKKRALLEKRFETMQKIFVQDVADAKNEMEALPESVQTEALITLKALQELSRAIKVEGAKNPKTEGMATTVAGFRLTELADGRRFGIFFGVGDSDGWLFRKNNNEIIRTVKTDNALEASIGSGGITRQYAERNATLPFIKELRFRGVTQALGSKKSVVPHVRAFELFPGDRFLLNSDGVSDNDPAENFKHFLRTAESAASGTRQIVERAFAGISRGEGKGADDVSAVMGEIRDTKTIEVRARTEKKRKKDEAVLVEMLRKSIQKIRNVFT